MMDDATYHAIERYLLGQMPADERAAFEARLAEDPVLAEQFARQQREHLAMQVLVEDRLRDKLKDWQKQHPLEDSFFHRYRILLGIIIMLLLFVVILWWFLPFGQTKAPEAPKISRQAPEQPIAKTTPPVVSADTPAVLPPSSRMPTDLAQKYLAIAAEFSEPVLFPTTSLRSEDALPDALDSAMLDLQARRFAGGLARLRAIPAQNPRYPDAQYFQGLAHYEQGEFGKAVNFLKIAADMPDYLYAEQAGWRLVLAYLQSGQPKSGQTRARKIAADEGHIYQEKAQELLKRMDDLSR